MVAIAMVTIARRADAVGNIASVRRNETLLDNDGRGKESYTKNKGRKGAESQPGGIE